MIKYAIKSLFQDRGKLFLSIFGVGVAILLILIMDGIFAGTEKQLTVYIDNTPVQIYVAQIGVKNMHMAKSFIPSSTENTIESVKGVNEVFPLNYLAVNVRLKSQDFFAYLIGWNQKQKIGGPWKIVKGKDKVAKDEVIVDKAIAQKYDLELGDKIKLVGKKFKIVGLTEGTYSMMSSIFFLDINALKNKLPPNTLSYLLVTTDKGANVNKVVERINSKLTKAHAITRAQFASSERRVTRKMGVEVIAIMTFISILAAIGVVALSIYSATLEKMRDFGVLKAIGANKKRLYVVVISQALFSTLLATLLGVALSLGLSQILKVTASEVLVIITLSSTLRTLIIALFIGIVAAVLPVRQIAAVDPVIVFKG